MQPAPLSAGDRPALTGRLRPDLSAASPTWLQFQVPSRMAKSGEVDQRLLSLSRSNGPTMLTFKFTAYSGTAFDSTDQQSKDYG